jgi:hypothetical protein
MKRIRLAAGAMVKLLSSMGLSSVLVLLLALLTWLGTLEQVNTGLYEVQKKYFESFFLVHRAGPIPIPLPGANLVLCILALNLFVGGMVRLRRGWRTAGILVVHVGIALLLLSGFVKMYFSEDGHLTLYENERSNVFSSYHRWELAISEDLGDGEVRELLVPQEDFADATGPRPVVLSASDLPFRLEVRHFMKNCRPRPKGPMFEVAAPVVDGAYLQSMPPENANEQNAAGLYVTVVHADGAREEGVLHGFDAGPWTVEAGGSAWALDLRHERYLMPFAIQLARFTKEDHPGITMPRAFSSDVVVVEGDVLRPVKISMNEPLRDRGLVLYQASWGPSTARPGDPLFSTLSVVRNPADQYPLYACIVISAGLLFHFARKLTGYVRTEAKRS